MSQQIPFSSVPQERNIYIKVNQVLSRGNNKVRSGIIERYTYKTDNGKLISSSSLNKNYNVDNSTCTRHVNGTQSVILRKSAPNVARTTIIKTNVSKTAERSLPPLPTKHHVIHPNVTLLKIGNSSLNENNEKVRTEHCDSTTDIIENMEQETMNILQNEVKFFSDVDHCYERYKKLSPSNSNSEITSRRFNSPQQSCNDDSDSDCQIIDIVDSRNSNVSMDTERYPVSQDDILKQNSDKDTVDINNLNNKEESPNSKVLNWITSKIDEPVSSEVHIISDSEEEIDNMCLYDRTELHTSLNETKINDLQSNSLSSLTLPSVSNKTTPDISLTKVNISSSTPAKPDDTVALINAKYHVVKNLLSADKKTHAISNVKELSQQCLLLRAKPPELCSPAKLLSPKTVLGTRVDITPPKIQKLSIQIPKINSQMSPESMKSEFYSYLKINTNPSAQKAETVAQNRRSIRVKNLIRQIEKNKEMKNEIAAQEKNKNNDVRKKFMKYSKFSFVFPDLPVHHNKVSDFDKSIESYFLQEKIQYPKNILEPKQNYKIISPTLKQKRKYRTNEKEITKCKNKFIKKPFKPRIDISQQFANMKLRRLRYGPNRINTSVRITRNSLDGYRMWNIKMLKARKAKLKARIKEKSIEPSINNEKDTDNQKIITTSLENTINVKIKEEKSSLPNVLDKLREPTSKDRPILKSISNHLQDKPKEIIQPKQMKNCTILLQMTNSRMEKYSRKTPTNERKDCKTSEYSPSAPINNEESMRTISTFCRNTPMPESEKELEFFTSSSQNTKIQNNDRVKKKLDNVRSISPPFLGFSSDKNELRKNHNLVSTLNTNVLQFEVTLSPKSDVNTEIPNNVHLLSNAQDIISLSSGNNTPVDDDSNSNSEEFSETSSVQEENKITVQEVVDTNLIEFGNPNYIPLNQNIKPKSFHKSLMQSYVKRKSMIDTNRSSLFELSDSDSSMSTPKTTKGPVSKRSQTHEIDISKSNGAVFNTYYVNGILIIVQEQLITFWKQTALGNILGVQNMWLPHGSIQRIILDPGCVNRRSSEMVLSCDNSVAYIELWTKEHKCMYRECPIADVFATIYFHKGHGLPDKKVLQLENIKGYGDDVRFAVIRNSREIIVSWCDTFSKPIKTLVRSYQLAADFQTVSSIKEMEVVLHYISSLHNIHDCDDLVLGAGNEQISVWNLRHGYLVTTLDLSETPMQIPNTNKTICLYAQCDTGFLFLIQQTEVGILRLVAVNGMTQEWKQLYSYQVPENYKKLLGVIVESGVLMTCYTNGFLCWNMHSGEVLAEIDTPNELIVLPSNKYMVAIDNYQVTVQHIMSYILTHDW